MTIPEQPVGQEDMGGSPSASLAPDAGSATPSDEVSRADIACLVAARSGSLRRRSGDALSCPTSAMPGVGWWAGAHWSGSEIDHTKGGPWSVERVARLCEFGLLAACTHNYGLARITKAGSAILRNARTQKTLTVQQAASAAANKKDGQ